MPYKGSIHKQLKSIKAPVQYRKGSATDLSTLLDAVFILFVSTFLGMVMLKLKVVYGISLWMLIENFYCQRHRG